MKKANMQEMIREALKRMELLGVSEEHQEIFKAGKIPVTLFSGEVTDSLDDIHLKALEAFKQASNNVFLPFYITESWHGMNIISVLYVSPHKEEWKEARQDAREFIHQVYAYNLADESYSEFGGAGFSIEELEESVLWRAY